MLKSNKKIESGEVMAEASRWSWILAMAWVASWWAL